ncbi:cell wall-binding repeat-containing protein [uncultured Mobiluncus sp.]|uniref:cell wall-binding repeat-containing protein n=1 Tax=uncultured Mobiluncus sp. TaxID=293425 RepID=UPI00262E98ED|nr:cell wall-binding repeat-containing protein [uncultured Mobiluncus sp.]
METRSHVGKKMRRAGLVCLFSAGLAFTGIAPASALSGEPVNAGDNSRPGITAVARVEVPHMAKYRKKGSTVDEDGAAVDICTGVLLDSRHIATMKSCVTNADGKPYAFSMSDKAGQQTLGAVPPPRVTFGSEAIPGKGPQNVFWISAVSFDPKAATQVVVARLDRDVPANVATPVKVKDNGVNGNMSGETGTMFGWRPEGGIPRIAYQETRLPITKLVNDTVTQPRSKVQQWNQWRESHPSFKDDKDLGTIPWDTVRKGWEDPEKIVVLPEDSGAPVISADGKTLIGIHVGLGIILDAQQTDFSVFLDKTRPAKTEETMVPNPDSPSAPGEALKIIQQSLCKNGAKPSINQESGMDGQTVSVTWGELKTETINSGVGIEKKFKDNPSFTDIDNTEFKKTDLNLGPVVVGEPRSLIEKISAAGCKTPDSGSIAEQVLKAQEDYEKIAGLFKARKEDEKTAQAEKDRYDDAIRELEEIKTQLGVYNNPNAISDFQTYHNYDGLPKWVREGIKYQDPDNNGKFCTDDERAVDPSVCRPQITPVEKFIDVPRDDPEAGKKLKRWYDDAADVVELRLKRLHNNQAEKTTALKEATKKVSNAQMNQAWAGKVLELAQKARTEADNLATNASGNGIEDKWQTEVKNRNAAFVEAYKSWADEFFNAKKAAADAYHAVKTQEGKVTAAQNALNEANALLDTDPNKENAIKQATDKLNSENATLDSKNTDYTAASKTAATLAAKKPNHKDEKYQPKIQKLSGKLAEVAQQMPNYKLNAINARWTIAALIKGMDGYDLVDPSEKDKIAAQIGGYYDRAVGARPDIMRRQIQVGDMLTEARNALATAPESMKPQLKILVSDLERHASRLDNAADTVNGAIDELKGLWESARRATSVDEAKKFLMQAQTALGTVDDPIDTSQKALEDAKGTQTAIKALLSGKSFEDVVNEKNMTPEQKAKKAAEEAKAKEEALRKKLEEELKKKYKIGQDGKTIKDPKQQAAEEKKARAERDKKAKADEKRLAKALSKNTLRAEGSNRVLTAIAAWKLGKFPGDSIVLVDGNVAADGLSSTPFAAGMHAPILLTTWKTGLEPSVMDQIKASGKKNLYLVGGQVPMTPYDEFELRDAGVNITRIAGPDRFNTAVAVNRATEPLIGAAPHKPLNLFIADGVGFPDALVAGAAAGRSGALMLLSKGNTLDPATYSYISELGQTRPLQITAVGGPAVRAVQNTPWPTTMSVNIKPIMGKDRYETAAALAASQPGTTAAVLVNGENFPDALSGGALAADQNAAMILTRAKQLPEPSYQALRRHGSEKTIVVGGPGAVSPKVAELVNGAKLNNDASKLVEGTLAESAALEAQTKAAEEKAKQDALNQVKGMMTDTGSMKNVLNQLGFTPESIKQLAAALNQPATK